MPHLGCVPPPCYPLPAHSGRSVLQSALARRRPRRGNLPGRYAGSRDGDCIRRIRRSSVTPCAGVSSVVSFVVPPWAPPHLCATRVAAPRASAVLPSHPRPRESWDPHSPARSARRPHVALRHRAMLIVSSHYGHARGTLYFFPVRPVQWGLPMLSVRLRLPTPRFVTPPTPCGHRPPALFLPQPTMSDRSTLSQDTPSPAPDTGRGGAIRRGPFPMFLMEISQSEDTDRLLRELDMLKDDALEAADTAIRATDPAPIRDQWAWVRSHAPSLPGIADVLRTFLSTHPPVQQVADSPATSPAEAAAANQAQGAAKKKGYTPQKVDPQTFSKALWVGWQEVDDPPSGEVDAGLLGGILRDKFGAGLSSITDEQLNHKAKFTIVGIRPAEYDRGMRLTRQHTARGWRVT